MTEDLKDTKILAEVTNAVALSYVLNLIIIFTMPQGGSITLGSMVPILILALRRGPIIGVIGGTIFGVLQMFLGGYIIHPVQALLDYPLAFAFLGLAGLFKKIPMAGIGVSLILRFLAHLLSGVVFFSEYAGDANPWIYSAIYNGSFILPELIISAILVYLLLQRDVLKLYM